MNMIITSFFLLYILSIIILYINGNNLNNSDLNLLDNISKENSDMLTQGNKIVMWLLVFNIISLVYMILSPKSNINNIIILLLLYIKGLSIVILLIYSLFLVMYIYNKNIVNKENYKNYLLYSIVKYFLYIYIITTITCTIILLIGGYSYESNRSRYSYESQRRV